MGSKAKINIIDKILPHGLNKNMIINSIDHMQIFYDHDSYKINLSKNLQNGDLKKYRFNTNKLDNSEMTFNVKKETFMKSVLNTFISNEHQLEIKPKKIVIDFSSPNIAKPFHAGHLRSTIIGNFIANIHKYFNNEVTKINYLGDWGTQFGLLQYGLQEKNINLEELKSNPIKALYDVYVYANKLSSTDENVQQQARKYFSDIEQGRTNLEGWKLIREVTVQELEKVYRRLGISFDDYHWESDYNGKAIKDIIDLLEQNGIIRNDETGKKITTINDRDVTILKSDLSTLYISRDIAALIDRYKRYKFDKMLYVVDNSQTDHFAAVFEVVKQINEQCTNGCEHIKFGRLKGMSTRTGNVVFLNDILNEAKEKMHEKQMLSKNTRSAAMNEDTCDTLGMSAVVINDLKQRRQKDYIFDWNRALQSEGDSGIKLQYLHCRLWSLEKNCGVSLPNSCEPDHLPEEIIGEVVAEIAKFDYILQRALVEYEACIIVNYLFRLARSVNRMFNVIKVKNCNADLAAQRLLVFHSARIVVKTGLEILGIKPLHEM